MAVDAEIYFPNLVAENLDLQAMSATETLERILNFEKAFVGEKLPQNEVQALGIASGSFKGQKRDSCRHCGFPHRSEDCKFSHLTCSACNTNGHLKRVCRFNKSANNFTESQDRPTASVSDQKGSNKKFTKKRKKFKRKKTLSLKKMPKK